MLWMGRLAYAGALVAVALVAAALAAVAAAPAAAQTGADFYKGKTVTYIVAAGPGGGYDIYARLVAEFMPKHLPGSTFVVKNVPGAGHVIGANTIYASSPNGLTIGMFNTGLIYNQLVNPRGVRFDLSRMSWVGKAASDPRAIVIAKQLPIMSFQELRDHKGIVNFSSGGFGSAGYVEAVMLTNVLKLPIKILTGYQGTDDLMAVRRGEIGGSFVSRSSWEAFVKSGYARFIAQIGGADQDVPQLMPMIADPTGRALVALIQSQGDIARLTAGPPNIPSDRLEALRTAFRSALTDPELLARAEKLRIPIEPLYGDDVQARIGRALSQGQETIDLLKSALEPKGAR